MRYMPLVKFMLTIGCAVLSKNLLRSASYHNSSGDVKHFLIFHTSLTARLQEFNHLVGCRDAIEPRQPRHRLLGACATHLKCRS